VKYKQTDRRTNKLFRAHKNGVKSALAGENRKCVTFAQPEHLSNFAFIFTHSGKSNETSEPNQIKLLHTRKIYIKCSGNPITMSVFPLAQWQVLFVSGFQWQLFGFR